MAGDARAGGGRFLEAVFLEDGKGMRCNMLSKNALNLRLYVYHGIVQLYSCNITHISRQGRHLVTSLVMWHARSSDRESAHRITHAREEP